MRALATICVLGIALSANEPRTPTVADAVTLARIQHWVTPDDRMAAISADGSRIAVVVWRGDLERNVNVYSLCVIELDGMNDASPPAEPNCPLAIDFEGDPDDQWASPFERVTFIGNGSGLAFLGRMGEGPAQVYTVDIRSRRVAQLTQHPTDVRSFVVDPNGHLRVFSAAARDEEDFARARDREGSGGFLFDGAAYPGLRRYASGAAAGFRQKGRFFRHYFWLPGPKPAKDNSPRLIFDSRTSNPKGRVVIDRDTDGLRNTMDEDSSLEIATLTGDGNGRHALLYPFLRADHDMQPGTYRYLRSINAYVERIAGPYGLIDLSTGAIEPLIDGLHMPYTPNTGTPVWSPDGRSVAINTLLASERDSPPQWVEVTIATRRITPLGLGDGWRVLSWTRDDTLLVTRGDAVGRVRQTERGGWAPVEELGRAEGLNSPHPGFVAGTTNGKLVIGIKQGATEAPEVAAYDLASKRAFALTNLNPTMKQRRYGDVEEIHWKRGDGSQGSGFLIKPVDYVAGQRYPLVVQLDDGVLRRNGTPYLLDGVWQYGGHPTQMLAAEGFAVLYARTPDDFISAVQKANEGKEMLEHIEAGIAHLDRMGVADTTRVGISGWSRAAYHVVYLLMHSRFDYAAATIIDGGASEYAERFRPYFDGELARTRAPILIQAHGARALVSHAHLADRLDAFGKAVDLLYFPDAPHNVVRPKQRQRSLEAHVDWWCFWLQGRRDADASKNAQYARWEALRGRRP